MIQRPSGTGALVVETEDNEVIDIFSIAFGQTSALLQVTIAELDRNAIDPTTLLGLKLPFALTAGVEPSPKRHLSTPTVTSS